jgi:hypothetical protein
MRINYSNLKFRIKTCSYLFVFVLSVGQIYAQKVYEIPEAFFRQDSVKLGEPVKLALIYKHKPNVAFLFPDSSYNFFPFEFIKKEFYPTKTDSSTSTDSVVYTLSTFEMDPVLRLSLPVYVYEKGDTLPIYSDDAEIFFSEVITQTSGTDSLRVNTEYKTLSSKLNYPYLAIGILILLLLAGIIFVFFRKTILRRYKLYLMSRDYNAFLKNFLKQKTEFFNLKSTSELETILSIWKKYLQKLEKKPYTTLTTKEISKIFDVNQITSALQNFDRAIYGGYIKEDLTNSIICLEETATLRYQQKQKDLQNV